MKRFPMIRKQDQDIRMTFSVFFRVLQPFRSLTRNTSNSSIRSFPSRKIDYLLLHVRLIFLDGKELRHQTMNPKRVILMSYSTHPTLQSCSIPFQQRARSVEGILTKWRTVLICSAESDSIYVRMILPCSNHQEDGARKHRISSILTSAHSQTHHLKISCLSLSPSLLKSCSTKRILYYSDEIIQLSAH